MRRLGILMLIASVSSILQAAAPADQAQIDRSQTAYETAISANPKDKHAHFMLGIIYEGKHEDAKALRAWNAYLDLETDPEQKQIAEKHIHRLTQ